MKPKQIGNPEAPYPVHQPKVGDIVHMPTGVQVTPEQMTAAVSDARIVYIGETHDNPAAHRLELQVLKAVAERFPGQVSLGLEMFNHTQQDTLDLWVQGELSEKEFLKQSDWYSVWGHDFDYYRDLLLYARDHQIPVVALNVTADFRRKIGMNALEELDAETRDQLPEMDLEDPYQTAMTEAIFADHTQGRQMLSGFQRVQTLWDEAMAESIVQHLSTKDASQRMVVIAGGNHIRYGFGIPRRTYRRMPTSYVLVGIKEIVIPKLKKGKTMDVDLPTYPMVPYDYLVFAEYESLPGERVKLGVHLREQDGNVVVEAVVPNSAAAAAGVQKGDVVVSFDEVDIKENFDLVYEIKQRTAGDSATMVVERDGQETILEVLFTSSSSKETH